MNNLIYTDEITDSDLRRTLVTYLMGLWIYLFSLYLWIGDFVAGLAAEGSADPVFTPQWIKVGLLVTSASVVLTSQLWYLRTKHFWSEGGSPMRKYIIELPVMLWILSLWAMFGVLHTDFSGVLKFRIVRFLVEYFVVFSAWILVAGIPAYSLAILYWIIRRSVDRRYPDTSRQARTGLSFALSLVSTVVIVLLQSFVALFLLNSIRWW